MTRSYSMFFTCIALAFLALGIMTMIMTPAVVAGDSFIAESYYRTILSLALFGGTIHLFSVIKRLSAADSGNWVLLVFPLCTFMMALIMGGNPEALTGGYRYVDFSPKSGIMMGIVLVAMAITVFVCDARSSFFATRQPAIA